MNANVASRVRQFAKEMPIARFTTSPLWDKARWTATTFRWHPTGDAPPVMGLVFEDAEAGERLFSELVESYQNADRFEEMRISIIEGSPAGQRFGYTVHIYPDPDALAMYATGHGIVLDPQANLIFGRWNRMYPVPGSPPLLPQFKEEFGKHGEFLLAPVTRGADGQQYFNTELGLIKQSIEFRSLPDVAENDIDAIATKLPELIRPRSDT